MFLVSACLIILLSGCATPKHRAKKNPEAFNSLHEEWQQLVLKGKIAEGMSTDALFIAMGQKAKMTDFLAKF